MTVLDKSIIRKDMKAKRLQMKTETFSLYNQLIFEQVLSHQQIQSVSMIACYVSLVHEVNTLKIIQELLKTKRVCVPKVEGEIMNFYEIHSLDDLKEGYFHVLEPTVSDLVLPQDIDCMLVPMVAFDDRLYRVGYGKGFYDKYFTLKHHYYKIGIAFEFQKVKEIDINKFDIALDEIITEANRYKR